MWAFYLAGAEMTFRCAQLVVFQFQLAMRAAHSLLLTRDYMPESERPGVSLIRRGLSKRRENADSCEQVDFEVLWSRITSLET